MKIPCCWSVVVLALGWLVAQPALLRAADEADAGASAEKKSHRGAWSFLWKADTLGERIGDKLTEDQAKKVNATRDEIRNKFKKDVEGDDKKVATKARSEATEAYRTALKGILSQTQFDKLFLEKEKKDDKVKKKNGKTKEEMK